MRFLRGLLKGKPYVSLAYMTGILPIAKYSSGSELNMFLEYTMATEERFSEYYGFTETEVDEIFYYIEKNVADIRDDLALMMAGEPVVSRIQEYAATSTVLQSREEIFSHRSRIGM